MTESLDLSKIKMPDEVIKSNVDNLELYADNHPFRLSLRISSFESEAEFNKFIKNVETTVRRSVEYKMWKKYIIDILGITTCMITQEKMDECTIEVHHHVPSLYLAVKALINKRLDIKQEFSTFDIALETIELHFANKIGYITLLKSMHEKFHNGYLSIPKEYIKGNYMSFLNEYSKYLDDTDLETINIRLATTEADCAWSVESYPGQQVGR